MTTLTATQSKTARKALGLSQAKVARETKVNRSILALFEVNKYILPDRTLSLLRDFYEAHGYNFDEKEAEPVALVPTETQLSEIIPSTETDEDSVDKHPIIDGIAVPSGLEQDYVETLFDEIYTNDETIAEILVQPVKRDWLTEEIDPNLANRAIDLMARNYALICRLRGHESLSSANDNEEDTPNFYADVLRQRLKR